MTSVRAGSGPPAPRNRYAGIVTRLLALVVDAALLALAALLIGLGGPALWSAVDGSAPDWLRVSTEVMAALLPFVYFWVGWWTRGHTLGGFLAGAAVRRKDGSRLGAGRAGARAFLGLLLAPVWLVGMVVVMVDSQRRALHDLLLGTVVLRTPP
jgi:uncharacterized RDD family membrane protein YckC